MSIAEPNRPRKASLRRTSAAAASGRRYCGVPIVSFAHDGRRASADAGNRPFDPSPEAAGVDVTKIGPAYGGSRGQGLGRGVADAAATPVDGAAAAFVGVRVGSVVGATVEDCVVLGLPIAVAPARGAAVRAASARRVRPIAPAVAPASTRQTATTTHLGALVAVRTRGVWAVGGGAPRGLGIGSEPRWWSAPLRPPGGPRGHSAGTGGPRTDAPGILRVRSGFVPDARAGARGAPWGCPDRSPQESRRNRVRHPRVPPAAGTCPASRGAGAWRRVRRVGAPIRPRPVAGTPPLRPDPDGHPGQPDPDLPDPVDPDAVRGSGVSAGGRPDVPVAGRAVPTADGTPRRPVDIRCSRPHVASRLGPLDRDSAR